MATALLIIDMQNAFVGMMDAPLPKIQKLHRLFDSCSWPVILTQHGHTPEQLQPPIKNQLVLKLLRDQTPPIMVGSRAWELSPDIWKMVKDAPVVAKTSYDAFGTGELDHLLHASHVRRLVVTGVMTEYCCHTTAIRAFTKDYETWLISDACGTEDEEAHERALTEEQDLGNAVRYESASHCPCQS
ncbi:hypothetical protein BAUCODRAFT_199193 [Baudoinia panamericana UAMH 10762]|uniref:Isochorismatase-like domain-containing protein n=1 Tax=Baudoinia panamericana (strain UAMH 10762) TaxID=717646 RepID=M2NAA0_BAUPA|nr:uncharacterized protein BAUCODRAFT_199193 [Baudoinia panamericana UAMH 10762]EMD01149.1 hypothetical protein BAUCODRAFT_199193 [Baudoinia panamericana UAMH 10762]